MLPPMMRPDLNLLVTLDVLLAEGSVAAAARRLGLSPSAMSRALARLRAATGDPLLVRAGRSLVPTPRALELRERVGLVVDEAEGLLRPQTMLAVDRLERLFTLAGSDGFVETFGAALLTRVRSEAPGVRLRFVPKPDRSGSALRAGLVDLETGVVGAATGPEVRAQALFRDRFVGVVRADHPLAATPVTAEAYAACDHVAVVRQGPGPTALDAALAAALAPLGLERRIVVMTGGFSEALALVAATDLVATVPDRHTAGCGGGLVRFALPVPTPEVAVSLLWHPRLDADPAHRWLRDCVRSTCREVAAAA